MQINNKTVPYPVNYESLNKEVEAKQNINQKNPKEINSTSDDSLMEPKTLKNMSLEQIQSYLETNNIEDDSNSRANALFDIQKFANKVDTATYNKMTTALLKEESASQASMRHATFPSEEILDENPKLFHALLDTTLGMEDTVHSLIFTLDFKQDYAKFQSEQGELNQDIDFSDQSFIEFLKKKVIELEDGLKDGSSLFEQNRIKDYSSLLDNFNNLLGEEDNTTVDIVV